MILLLFVPHSGWIIHSNPSLYALKIKIQFHWANIRNPFVKVEYRSLTIQEKSIPYKYAFRKQTKGLKKSNPLCLKRHR